MYKWQKPRKICKNEVLRCHPNPKYLDCVRKISSLSGFASVPGPWVVDPSQLFRIQSSPVNPKISQNLTKQNRLTKLYNFIKH